MCWVWVREMEISRMTPHFLASGKTELQSTKKEKTLGETGIVEGISGG